MSTTHVVRQLCPRLELSFGDYNVNGASINYGREGTKFAFTIGPVADATVSALEDAAEKRGTLCLLLPEPLVLDHISLECKDPYHVRIVGRIIESATARLQSPPSL